MYKCEKFIWERVWIVPRHNDILFWFRIFNTTKQDKSLTRFYDNVLIETCFPPVRYKFVISMWYDVSTNETAKYFLWQKYWKYFIIINEFVFIKKTIFIIYPYQIAPFCTEDKLGIGTNIKYATYCYFYSNSNWWPYSWRITC